MFSLAIGFKVLAWVLPILLAPVVYVAARQLLNVHRSIDDLPAWAKRIAVMLLGIVIVGALSAFGVAIPHECIALPDEFTRECAEALTGANITKGVAVGITAMFLHRLKKSNPRT